MPRSSSPCPRRVRSVLLGAVLVAFGSSDVSLASAASVDASAAPAVAPAVASAGFAPVPVMFGANSANWAGWVSAGRHTSVSASWHEPSVTCAAHETSDSAFWVGLDGYGSGSVEQVGTQAGCSDGHRFYSAWTEFYPAPPAAVTATVRAGDAMHASVTFVSGHTYRLTLSDSTRGWYKTLTGSASRAMNASAEIVAEAPTAARTGRIMRLSRFSQARFTGVTVDRAPLSRLVRRQQLVMGSTRRVMAQTSAVDSSGGSFSVSWRASAG